MCFKAAPRASRAGILAIGEYEDDTRQCSHSRRNQLGFGSTGRRTKISQRSVLPAQGLSDHRPSSARPPGRYSLLVRHIAQKFAQRMKKHIETIPSDAMKALQAYPWPGNVRELENFIERAVILTQGQDLFVSLAELKPTPSHTPNSEATTLEQAEREHILKVLRESNWAISGPAGASTKLGMKRTTLQSKMQKLNISRPR
jgi:hypothetical protein